MTQAQVTMIDGKDLPLHCPTNKTPAWNSHPRVFLDITKTGEAKCPYCGAEYKLIPGTEPHGHQAISAPPRGVLSRDTTHARYSDHRPQLDWGCRHDSAPTG